MRKNISQTHLESELIQVEKAVLLFGSSSRQFSRDVYITHILSFTGLDGFHFPDVDGQFVCDCLSEHR